MTKKKKVSPFYSKYCYKERTEPWNEYAHRIEIEKEIADFLQRSRYTRSLDMTEFYHLLRQTPVQQEALRNLAEMIVFRPSRLSHRGNLFGYETRQSLVTCLSDPGLTVDWCIYRPKSIPITAVGTFWVTHTNEQAASLSRDDIFLKQIAIKEELLARCRCKLLWYLLNYRSTPVVLPGDRGVLRKIIGFIV